MEERRVALKTTRDEQSVAMLDTIMDGVTYDFAFLHYPLHLGLYRSKLRMTTTTNWSAPNYSETAQSEKLRFSTEKRVS